MKASNLRTSHSLVIIQTFPKGQCLPSLKGSSLCRLLGVCSRPNEMGTQNIYIAVVDDDESVCRSFSRLLRAAHFQPISYSSAEEFLADTKQPKFDCLVLDIQLRGMSGLELRKRLAAVRDSTPVVFITAYDNPEVAAAAEASGFSYAVIKTTGVLSLTAASLFLSSSPDIPRS